jgi:hypothetical protein
MSCFTATLYPWLSSDGRAAAAATSVPKTFKGGREEEEEEVSKADYDDIENNALLPLEISL